MSAAVPSPRSPTAPSPSRGRALALVALAYLAGLAAALVVGAALADRHPLLVIAAADLAATCVVFAFSRALDNSSVYDPYWSIVPPVVCVYLLARSGDAVSARAWIVAALVLAWGGRLTWNWARSFPGLTHEDWRYVDFRRKSGRAYWIVSFFGLHLFPTVWVYLGMLPLVPAMSDGGHPLGLLDALAFLVTAGAVAIEALADEQLRRFRASGPGPGAIMQSGLWALSRHPNYFGEVSFWCGLFLFGLAADPAALWPIAGPIAIVALFVFASIPMLDRRSVARRPEYAEHMRRVSALVPWFPKKSGRPS